MAKFTWQDGTLVSKAKVEIGGTIYEVDPEEYSGATPLSASNLNAMQDGIYEDLGDVSDLQTESNNLVAAINEVNNINSYSTTEKKIGKSSDGRDVYFKEIFLSNVGVGTEVSISDLNIYKIESYEATIQQNNSDRQVEHPYFVSSTDNFRVLFQLGNNKINVLRGSSLSSNNTVDIKIKYTKN